MNADEQNYTIEPLPWSWQQKLDDFIKPGDTVINLADYPHGTQAIESGTANVLLSLNTPIDYAEATRILKKNGFYICQQIGGEHHRTLAEYLTPNSRAVTPLNLENELPKMQAAGFRVMFRAQAYPVATFNSTAALLKFIAANPSHFPNFSQSLSQSRLAALPTPTQTREHHFILIGRRAAAVTSHPSEI